jgi:hypothetical protein
MNRRLTVFPLAVLLAAAMAHAQSPPALPACDPDNTLPEGFCAFVAADSLGAARHRVAPNGTVYLAVQNRGGDRAGVIALRDADGDGSLYIAESTKGRVWRVVYHGAERR